eukprot:3568160-Rhodomonas_salina.2
MPLLSTALRVAAYPSSVPHSATGYRRAGLGHTLHQYRTSRSSVVGHTPPQYWTHSTGVGYILRQLIRSISTGQGVADTLDEYRTWRRIQ